MPKDLYIFLLLLVGIVGIRFLNVSPGLRLFFIVLLILGQVLFLLYLFRQSQRRR